VLSHVSLSPPLVDAECCLKMAVDTISQALHGTIDPQLMLMTWKYNKFSQRMNFDGNQMASWLYRQIHTL